MMDFRQLLASRWVKAVSGAIVIHGVGFVALMAWHPEPLPARDTIPVILIELPPIAPVADPAPLPEPDLLNEPELVNEFVPESDPQPLPVEAEAVLENVSSVREAAPAEEEVGAVVAYEPAPPAGISLAQTTPEDIEAKEAATSDIPSQYIYTYDPFAETAPTAMARVSRAINCARANQETRPAFCPNYNEDDLFIAAITQNRTPSWERGGYDPVADTVVARAVLGDFAAAQLKPKFTGKSESFTRTHPQDQDLPDAGCRYVSYGFADPFALDKSAAVPENRSVSCE